MDSEDLPHESHSAVDVELQEDGFDENNGESFSAPQDTNVASYKKDADSLQDSSVLSSQSSKFDMEDTTELDDLLQSGHLRRGCMGALERLPLFVKLFMMLFVALLGLLGLGIYVLVFTSQNIRSNRQSKQAAVIAGNAGSLVSLLQLERYYAYVNVLTPNSQQTNLDRSFTNTDAGYAKFLSQLSSASKLIETRTNTKRYLGDFKARMEALKNERQRIFSLYYNGTEIYDMYGEISMNLINVVLTFTDLAQDHQLFTALNSVNIMREYAGRGRAIAGSALQRGNFTGEEYVSFAVAYGNQILMINHLLACCGDQVAADLRTYALSRVGNTSLISQQLLDTPTGDLTQYATPTSYLAVTNSFLTGLISFQTDLIEKVVNSAERSMRKGIGTIVVLVIIVTFLFVLSVTSALLFSQAITGPWRRIITIQESTIKKFVPKGFLRIIKCYRLADISLGKSVERDLTVMFADIRNYTAISETMTPSQNFNFLNKYLANVGPVIRKHGGYIDKFMGDGIMSCFPNLQNGIKASLEMQECITTMNKQNPSDPHIRVGIGIHCGKVMVGAIGENERMEGTIISSTVNLTSRLETLTKAFRAKILTTQESMKRLKNTSEFSHRPLGFVKVKGKKKFVKIYELIDKSETHKLETLKEFKEAVEIMLDKNYERSLEMFDLIVAKHPDDIGAMRLRDSSNAYLEITREQLKNIQVHDALEKPELREAFAQFCSDERSEENFKFWCQIEDFRKADSDKRRISLTKKMFKDFLSNAAKHRVNTSDDSSKMVKQAIIAYDENLNYPDPALFNPLQIEIEILMADTFARFRKTPLFMPAFKKSLPVPLVHIMDEDTL